MDPKQDRLMRSRGPALWGNLVITGAGGLGNSPRIIATDKETGKAVWETSFSDTPDVTFTAAPLAIKGQDHRRAANGDQGVRDWIAGLDAATGSRLCKNIRSRRRANRAARPGKATPMPGATGAARCG